MNNFAQHKKNEEIDRRKSMLITFLFALLAFLVIYFYKFTRIIPKSQEVVTTMLINFGDNREGLGTEEPAIQELSIPSNEVEEVSKPIPEPEKKPVFKEKIITGKDTKITAPKADKATKKVPKTSTKNTQKPQNTTSDRKAIDAINKLNSSKKNGPSSQGNKNEAGNQGDPLGGNSNGDSKIGVDRKLIGFIPGTMGKGGVQPNHNCSASGTISIAYVVDKSGNVISAKRSGGINDPCVVSTTVSWVKKHVKAEKANTSSTGTYKITF